MSNKLSGREALGIEFGSTRVKAALIDENANLISSGVFEWTDSLADGWWSYSFSEIKKALSGCYSDLLYNLKRQGLEYPRTLSAIGISGMMHGYIPLDKDYKELVSFRTWRNTRTAKEADFLSSLFNFNIPQRWSVAHMFHAAQGKEEHIKHICHISTLSVYVTYLLCGEFYCGIGEASGMFPVDSKTFDYDSGKIKLFDEVLKKKGFNLNLKNSLPKILKAGQTAGRLTQSGADLLDRSGTLKPGIPICPPEGDAQTGMIATNSIKSGVGNISAGTSAFSMIVLNDKDYKTVTGKKQKTVDFVSTPDGKDVAMVHANNCSGDLDAWVNLFLQFSNAAGSNLGKNEVYDILYGICPEYSNDTAKIINYNFFSGEPVLSFSDGFPVLLRRKDADFNLGSFFKSQIYSSFAVLAIGMQSLKKDGIKFSSFTCHGGMFKNPVSAQVLADMINCPVNIMKLSGEGGSWGMAVLALYSAHNNIPLSEFLDLIFNKTDIKTFNPTAQGVKEAESYIRSYKANLSKIYFDETGEKYENQ